jgi:hypothetical protein
MLNEREARQRCAVYNIHFSKRDGEYRIAPAELKGARAEAVAYYTDDLDDVVLTAAAMRKAQG